MWIQTSIIFTPFSDSPPICLSEDCLTFLTLSLLLSLYFPPTGNVCSAAVFTLMSKWEEMGAYLLEIHKSEKSQTSLTPRRKTVLWAADRLPLMNACVVLWWSCLVPMPRNLKLELLFPQIELRKMWIQGEKKKEDLLVPNLTAVRRSASHYRTHHHPGRRRGPDNVRWASVVCSCLVWAMFDGAPSNTWLHEAGYEGVWYA